MSKLNTLIPLFSSAREIESEQKTTVVDFIGDVQPSRKGAEL